MGLSLYFLWVVTHVLSDYDILTKGGYLLLRYGTSTSLVVLQAEVAAVV